MTYKSCAVPMCKSTSIKCPDKLFIHVPPNSKKSLKRRKQWLMLARRDPKFTSDQIYFCQDHFDLPNDMENYMQYCIMGSGIRIRMKPDCLPSKFQCQPDRRVRTAPSLPRAAALKRQRKDIIQELLDSEETKTPAISETICSTDYNGHNKSYDHKIKIEVEHLETIYLPNIEAGDQNVRVKEEPVVKEENLEYYNEYDSSHEHRDNLEIKEEQLDINIKLQENEIIGTRNEPESTKEDTQDLNFDSSKWSTQNGKHIRRGSRCNVCDRYFENRKHLETHIKVCAMSYSCKICDEQFNKLSLLRPHILTHIDATAYTCDVCSKTFARRADLKSHERTHTGEKPYTCDFCRKSFSHVSNLKRHKKAHVG